jgi:hypothetical protein
LFRRHTLSERNFQFQLRGAGGAASRPRIAALAMTKSNRVLVQFPASLPNLLIRLCALPSFLRVRPAVLIRPSPPFDVRLTGLIERFLLDFRRFARWFRRRGAVQAELGIFVSHETIVLLLDWFRPVHLRIGHN